MEGVHTEVINLTPSIWTEEEIQKTQEIVRSWGLSASIYDLLKMYGVNSIDVLDKMELEDMEKFFSDINSSGYFGDRVKFKAGLKQWRKDRNKPLLCDQETLSPPSTRKVLEWLEKISNDLNASSLRASTTNNSRVSEPTEHLFVPCGGDVSNLLKSTIKGQFVLSYYEKNQFLESRRQKDLTHCSFIGKNMKMSYTDMNHWTDAIVEIFPSEKPETYFLSRKTGKTNST